MCIFQLNAFFTTSGHFGVICIIFVRLTPLTAKDPHIQLSVRVLILLDSLLD